MFEGIFVKDSTSSRGDGEETWKGMPRLEDIAELVVETPVGEFRPNSSADEIEGANLFRVGPWSQSTAVDIWVGLSQERKNGSLSHYGRSDPKIGNGCIRGRAEPNNDLTGEEQWLD